MRIFSLLLAALLAASPALASNCYDAIEVAKRHHEARKLDLLPLNGYGDGPLTQIRDTPYFLSPAFTNKHGKQTRCLLKREEFGTPPTVGSITEPIDCFEEKEDKK